MNKHSLSVAKTHTAPGRPDKFLKAPFKVCVRLKLFLENFNILSK